MTGTMEDFSKLDDDRKVKIGHVLGHHVIGGTTSPEQLIDDGFLENHNVNPDEDVMLDSVVCAAFDQIAFCCTACGWYCEMSECNDDPKTGEWVCDDCMPETGEEE